MDLIEGVSEKFQDTLVKHARSKSIQLMSEHRVNIKTGYLASFFN